MAKLKLQLEDLSVESFDTDVPKQRRGTVFGCQANTCGWTCNTCGQYTCYHSCDLWCTEGETCDANGFGTCGMRQC